MALGKQMMKSSTAMTPAGGQSTQAGGAQAESDGPEQATPEEQKAYEAYVNAALEAVLTGDGQPEPAVLASLKGEYDQATAERFAAAEPPIRTLQEAPIDPLAATTVAALLQVEDIAAQSGVELADEIVFNGGAEVLAVLADMSETAGIHSYSEDDIETAVYRAVDLYRISSSRVNPDQLKQEFGAFIEADRAGAFEGGG
jgi:hypothetical protein